MQYADLADYTKDLQSIINLSLFKLKSGQQLNESDISLIEKYLQFNNFLPNYVDLLKNYWERQVTCALHYKKLFEWYIYLYEYNSASEKTS